MTKLNLAASTYRCEPCSLKQGTNVRELVRMIPFAMVMGNELVGEEFFCCPICFEPKFDIKTRKKVVGKSGTSKKPARHLSVAGD